MGDRLWDLAKRAQAFVGLIAGIIFLGIALGPRGAKIPTIFRVGAILLVTLAIAGNFWFAFEKGNVFVEIRNKTISDRKRITLAIFALVFFLGIFLISLYPPMMTEMGPLFYICLAFLVTAALLALFKLPRSRWGR